MTSRVICAAWSTDRKLFHTFHYLERIRKGTSESTWLEICLNGCMTLADAPLPRQVRKVQLAQATTLVASLLLSKHRLLRLLWVEDVLTGMVAGGDEVGQAEADEGVEVEVTAKLETSRLALKRTVVAKVSTMPLMSALMEQVQEAVVKERPHEVGDAEGEVGAAEAEVVAVVVEAVEEMTEAIVRAKEGPVRHMEGVGEVPGVVGIREERQALLPKLNIRTLSCSSSTTKPGPASVYFTGSKHLGIQVIDAS